MKKPKTWLSWISGIWPTYDVKEKQGKKDEVKILDTKSRQRILKELILIRRFLNMDATSKESLKIHDERTSRIWAEGDDDIQFKKKEK